ncbi:MAG TPA: diguanylate cyclase, partial [Burkholderiaceae bacterium]|nr:diguanylate cyclase [Burkholderiaceae bacterium]
PFELESAHQGEEALDKVEDSLAAERPYAMAFVDMRMPPGWNGVETVERLWQADPRLQIVLCTAHSDLPWDEVLARLAVRDRLLILKKPFDPIEVYQLANALCTRWDLSRLEDAVAQRAGELNATNAALRRDIIERKRAEAELRLAASAFHDTMDGVMIVDPAGVVLSVNPAFAAMTGYPVEQMPGRPAHLLRCGRQSARFYRDLWTTLARVGRWQGELWTRRHDGEVFLAWLNIVTVTGSDGRAERHVCVFHDITTLRRNEDRIRHLAFHDPLTGLPNRALLQDRLDQAIASTRRDRESLGLLFIDLDRFKVVNDSFGHDAGNALLKEVAGRLTGCLRRSDTVARIGGDEFVLLLRGLGMPQSYALVAQAAIDALSVPMVLDGHAMQVGASIGIACFPDDGLDAATLMTHADMAMYAAKAAGRGTYRFFQPSLADTARPL